MQGFISLNSILGKCSRQHFEILFLFIPRKYDLTSYALVHRKPICMKYQTQISGKNSKNQINFVISWIPPYSGKGYYAQIFTIINLFSVTLYNFAFLRCWKAPKMSMLEWWTVWKMKIYVGQNGCLPTQI